MKAPSVRAETPMKPKPEEIESAFDSLDKLLSRKEEVLHAILTTSNKDSNPNNWVNKLRRLTVNNLLRLRQQRSKLYSLKFEVLSLVFVIDSSE